MFAGASVDDSAYTGDMNDYTIAGKWWQESWYFLFHVDWIFNIKY